MAETKSARPLSPHLQVYRPTITMTMSIVHRITGMALYSGTLLLAWWLVALASGPEAYGWFEWFISSIIGKLVLLGYTWALLHHLLGGLRHFLWDTGRGFDLKTANTLGWASIIGSLALTVVVWILAFVLSGVL